MRRLGERCQTQSEIWQNYLQTVRQRLNEKDYRPQALDEILGWLQTHAPAENKLPPLLQLRFQAARLAADNHQGRMRLEAVKNLLDLGNQLKHEAAPEIAQVYNRLAVAATNVYEFDHAKQILQHALKLPEIAVGRQQYGRLQSGMAELATAKDAFSGTEKVNGSTVSRLKPELAGFEMIVASSNNAAVENISRDLPKKSSLGATYCTGSHPSYVYLDKIARNLFAKNKQKYDALPPDDDTWGLFSCALGKKGNREKVRQGLFFAPQNHDECKGYDEALHQSIWKWRSGYQGISFAQAQENFKRQLDIVEQKLNDLDGYFILHEETVLNPETNQAALQQQYGTCAKSVQTEKEKLNDARQTRIETQTAELQDIPVHSDFILAVSDAKSRLQAATQKVSMPLTDEDGEQRAYWRIKSNR